MPIYFRNTPVTMPFMFDSVGNHWYQESMQRPNGHPHYHYLQTEKGRGRIEIRGKHYILEEQEGILIAPSVPHSYTKESEEWDTVFATFTGTLSSGISSILQNQSVVFVSKEQGCLIEHIISDAVSEFQKSIPDMKVLSTLCYDLLLAFTLDTSSGNLTADPQSGGWLKGCGIDVNNGAFYVDPSGNVTMKGSINMADGSITWGSGNSPCLVLYCSIAASPPTGSYNSYPSRGSTSWHKSINDGDLYASYTYDGGVTWTSAIKIRGEDGQNGKDGQDGMDGSDATVNERNVFNVLTNGGTKFGVFSDSSTRKLYINASYIRAGQIDADLITLGSEYGGFCCARGSDGVSFTYGAKMYGSDDEYYFIATNKGVRMQAPDHGFTITNNGLFADEEISVGSDRRLKQAIEYRMDKYENFFMKLKPTQYQLKAGKSKRLHTGFIAQDVERALLESGLTTNDFAGLTITPVQEVNPKDGIDDVFYRLRYGEFISLNTYMIQTLYRRISELEEKIKSL